MRRVLVLVMTCACGRIGFDAPKAMLDDGSPDATGDAMEIACEDRPGILFCDGFEGGTLLASVEVTPPSFVVADAEQVFRGQTSLHAQTTRTFEPAWYIGTVLPELTSGEIHARWYHYYPSTAPNRTFASIHLISNEEPYTGVVFGATNGTIDVSASENDDFHNSTVMLPLDRWFCVQLRFTIATAGSIETFIDGTPAARLDNIDTLPVGGIGNVHAGLFTATNGGVNDLWTDELAIGLQPIACL